MDEEWEILPHDGFLDYYGGGEKRSHLGNRRSGKTSPKIVLNTDYFVCPSSPPKNSSKVAAANQLVPVPIQLEPRNDPDSEIPKEVTLVPPVIIPKPKDSTGLGPNLEADKESVSQQVSFKKMKEHEFVDMKLDSPTKSFATTATIKGFMAPGLPQIDAATASFGFEEKADGFEGYKIEGLEGKITSPRMGKKEKESGKDQEVNWEDEENGGGVNLWKWSLTGVGAICSFGVAAAATICIIILGSHQKGNQHQNQKLGLQIYSDDKRIKQVVHHATKLNEAISVARGVPITRAHVTFGGYYDGL